MRLSLSKKEVAEIHLMLTTLPIPPIPVVVTLDSSRIVDEELKTAFQMATVPIVQDSSLQDGIVNAHSVIAAMSFFNKWSVSSTSSDDVARQNDIQNKKDACLLRIIASILDYNSQTKLSPSASKDDDILQIFVTASQDWVNTYLPECISVGVDIAPTNKVIGFEHDMHVAMAHYCYSQGVLYNSKDSKLKCTVHDALYNDYLKLVKETAEDISADEDSGSHREEMHEHIEIAKMYSQFPYHKMLLLCFDRLLNDCLYGHTLEVPGNDVEQNARDLLKVSFDNYETMMARHDTPPSTQVSTNTITDPLPTGTDLIQNATLDSRFCEIGEMKKQTSDLETPQPNPGGVKRGCVSEIGSYKSYIGMFITGVVNFLRNADPYSVSNMSASLRHLKELATGDNEITKEACALINISALVQLVRTQMLKNPCHRDMQEEIETILFELQQISLLNVNMIETKKTVETVCSVHSLEAGDTAQKLEDIHGIHVEGVRVQATAIIDLHEKSEVLALVDTCVVTPSNVVAASDVEITQTIL